MKKVPVIAVYQFGYSMADLRSRLKAGLSTREYYMECNQSIQSAISFLQLLLRPEASPLPLSGCSTSATLLLNALINFRDNKLLSPHAHITQQDIDTLNRAYVEFESAFAKEAPGMPVYLVSQKGGFSTDVLLESAESVLPNEVVSRLSPDCILDIREAGRCLAFELGTACGFYAGRALESVAKGYVDRRNLTARPPGLSEYIRALGSDGASRKAMSVLQQLKDTRRNPICQPGGQLTLPEAVTVFHLCTSAIKELIADMEARGLY